MRERDQPRHLQGAQIQSRKRQDITGIRKVDLSHDDPYDHDDRVRSGVRFSSMETVAHFEIVSGMP